MKWIFIISIAELMFWLSLIFLIPDSYKELTEALHIKTFIWVSNIIHFAVIGVFIFLFYKNYKSITVTDSTKSLMKSILKTRKTVKNFVYYNIGMFVLSSIIMNFIYYNNSDALYEFMDFAATGMPQENFVTIFIVSQVIVGILFLGLLMLFYYLIYGLLLRRLKGNYKELKKIEV